MAINSDPGLAAASILNFFSLLMFWLRHLPPRLPSPGPGADGIYVHFYQIMQQVQQLGQLFPDSVPYSDGVITIRVHEDITSSPTRSAPAPEAQAPGARPAPQPQPRRPRDADPSVLSPEAMQLPPPQPILYTNKRKSFIPIKRETAL